MKPLTKKWARKMLGAVNELIEMYKEGRESNGCIDCPLCLAVNEYRDFVEDVCVYCPWEVFNKQYCVEEGKEYFTLSYKKRLPRLYGWRKKLLNIINKPTKRGGCKSCKPLKS